MDSAIRALGLLCGRQVGALPVRSSREWDDRAHKSVLTHVSLTYSPGPYEMLCVLDLS